VQFIDGPLKGLQGIYQQSDGEARAMVLVDLMSKCTKSLPASTIFTLSQSDPMNNGLQHIAIIMDGNGRWAKKRLMPRTVGHVRGAANVRQIVKASNKLGIRYLTLFAFSSENWRRPADEVSALMGLFLQYLESEVAEMKAAGIRLRVIGDRSAFAPMLQSRIDQAEQDTAQNTQLHLTIAANYGGQWDVLNAMRGWQAAHPHQSLQDMDARLWPLI
jgi:undecaprenyl diphosphate synthase